MGIFSSCLRWIWLSDELLQLQSIRFYENIVVGFIQDIHGLVRINLCILLKFVSFLMERLWQRPYFWIIILTYSAVSYVDAKRIGASSFETKFLTICLIESVLRTVEMPSRDPRRLASVLFPVPEVPAKSTMMCLLFSMLSWAKLTD
jgi:hypothetical protein